MFSNSIFINCPFDRQYQNLLRAILFTVCKLKLIPKISETKSSSDSRIDEIINLMKSSKYSIHDLSFNGVLPTEKYARFNMPFELGIDIGMIKTTKKKGLKDKRIIIFEKDSNKYDQYISDISGYDIEAHSNNSNELIKRLRDWFYVQGFTTIPNSKMLIDEFEIHETELLELYNNRNLDINNPYAMPKIELIDIINTSIEYRLYN